MHWLFMEKSTTENSHFGTWQVAIQWQCGLRECAERFLGRHLKVLRSFMTAILQLFCSALSGCVEDTHTTTLHGLMVGRKHASGCTVRR
jgi:hypothetical protein